VSFCRLEQAVRSSGIESRENSVLLERRGACSSLLGNANRKIHLLEAVLEETTGCHSAWEISPDMLSSCQTGAWFLAIKNC
jgi:hypothetical protein